MSIFNKIQRAFACSVIQKKEILNLSEPVISFTFDDVPDSGLINGARILKRYGYDGTYYLSLGLMDENRPGGKCNDINQLKSIVAEGGELACHTYNHIHMYTSAKNEIISDLAKNQEKIMELIPNYKFSNFSYPYGEQTLTSKIIIRDKYRTARSIKRGINSNPVDLNNLKAIELMEGFDLDNVWGYILKAIELKAWLILYTHDIEENPSRYGCSPAYFESVVKFCSEKKLKVLTVEKAMQFIHPHA